jgi:hypothetical protein
MTKEYKRKIKENVDSVALMVAEKETLLKERRELEQSLSKYA